MFLRVRWGGCRRFYEVVLEFYKGTGSRRPERMDRRGPCKGVLEFYNRVVCRRLLRVEGIAPVGP